MTTPTPQALKEEVESGPLAADLAAYWSDTFQAHPTKPGLDSRVGRLKPDAAFEIRRVLNDPTRRTKTLKYLTRGDFLAALAPMVLLLPTLSDAKQKVWERLLNMLTGSNADVDVTRPSVQALLDVAVSDGLLTSQQRAALANGGTSTQSRLEELGWSNVTAVDLDEARLLSEGGE